MRVIYLLFTFVLMFSVTSVFAGDRINTEDHAAGSAWMSDHMMDKAAMKSQQKLDKQLLKAEKQQQLDKLKAEKEAKRQAEKAEKARKTLAPVLSG